MNSHLPLASEMAELSKKGSFAKFEAAKSHLICKMLSASAQGNWCIKTHVPTEFIGALRQWLEEKGYTLHREYSDIWGSSEIRIVW